MLCPCRHFHVNQSLPDCALFLRFLFPHHWLHNQNNFKDHEYNFLIRISPFFFFFKRMQMYLLSTTRTRERETKKKDRRVNEKWILKKSLRIEIYACVCVEMSDIKTEVIVNGSWRASCELCFQGIDEDTSSVRVLLLACLWESTEHVHAHLLTLDLFYVSFSLSLSPSLSQVFVIVNCSMLLIYMRRQTFTT